MSLSQKQISEYGPQIAVGTIILVVFILLITYNCNDNFANIVNGAFGRKKSIKDLDVIFIMNPECPWCAKQIEVLKADGSINDITIVDISKPGGPEQAKMYGTKGFPFFVSLKNKTATMGFKEKTDDIIKELTGPVAPVAQKAQEAGTVQEPAGPTYVLITRETCPWCTKAKENIVQSGAPFANVDFNSEQAKEILKMFDIKSKSVPIYVNLKNGKNLVGFKPVADVLSLIN
jgi:glutaredoxin